MNDQEPENLVSLFNQGNNKAFDAIYKRYSDAVFYFTRQFIGVHQEAEDIVSEVFLKLWKLRGNFENLEKIRSFLYIAAKNECLDYLRHEKIKNIREEEIIRLLSMEGDMISNKEKIYAELKSLLHAAVEQLPTKCREIFQLCYIEGVSNEEAALRLHINVKTVYNQKLLALTRLRLQLLK